MFPLAYYTPYAEKGTGQGRGFGMTKDRKRKHVYEKCVKKKRPRTAYERSELPERSLFFTRLFGSR